MKKYILSVFLMMPLVVNGQHATGAGGGPLELFLDTARDFIFGPVLYFLIAVAFIAFVWGVIKYFISDAESDKTAAKSLMLWGIGGFVLILTIWVIVNMLVAFLGLGDPDLGPLPPLPIDR